MAHTKKYWQAVLRDPQLYIIELAAEYNLTGSLDDIYFAIIKLANDKLK